MDDVKGLEAATEALRSAGMKREGSSRLTLGTVIATDLARAAITAYLSARSAEPVAWRWRWAAAPEHDDPAGPWSYDDIDPHGHGNAEMWDIEPLYTHPKEAPDV